MAYLRCYDTGSITLSIWKINMVHLQITYFPKEKIIWTIHLHENINVPAVNLQGCIGLEPTNRPIAISALHRPHASGDGICRSEIPKSCQKKHRGDGHFRIETFFSRKDSKPKRSMYSIPIMGCLWYLSKWIMNDYDILYCNSFSN